MRESILGFEIQKMDGSSPEHKHALSIGAMAENQVASSQFFNNFPTGVYSVTLAIDDDGSGYVSNAHELRYFKTHANLGFI